MINISKKARLITTYLSLLLLLNSCSKGSTEQVVTPIITYTLIVTVSSGGIVDEAGGIYNENTEEVITATANVDFYFSGWSGDASGTDNPLTVLMNRNKSIVANFVASDDDMDGVINALDQCRLTPEDESVNDQGCASFEIDTDGDGVNDIYDQDNTTRQGAPVDQNGVMLNPVIIGANGFTIVANAWAIPGDVGELNGTVFTVVSEDELRVKITNNEDITSVCTSRVTNMSALFEGANTFNQDISHWDTSAVTNMRSMFSNASVFNQAIGNWDTSNVTDTKAMFSNAEAFDQDIHAWDTSNIIDASSMFNFALLFNQDLGRWDITSVTNLTRMFYRAESFNQDIGNWDTSGVTSTSGLFWYALVFNQNISSWNVSDVTDMSLMFYGAEEFNQNIGSWNTSNVTDMGWMFLNAFAFNQDLSGWCVSNVTSENETFSENSALTEVNLPIWGTCPNN